ncbi:hypothetical protein EFP18_08900 [Burkholderia glumae]|uniref:hypothetical protein n=1 Tax=Burkholderia glumae TaxID=337 RepID=UPI0002D808DC|nr:hypothetical protein [Burkholderia glumae]MCM2495490.1 hypothetical protein [Burkholderia glumae]MCM2552182.1 hypothetical protein [Burkholderia glumae]MCQ0031243.1 hypothetical protein [Burkholderia glumae]MCQ0036661.1 hypothetical protein [Burkholderia glumae]MCR1767221.1 hypothetical protein [Burkholderia glumae]
MKKAVFADAVGGVVLTVFVTAVLTMLHAQVGGNHGIVNFLGSAELPIVASVLMLDSLREAIGSIYEGEHRQNIFVAGIILFVVALLLASKGVDIEVARHHALESAVSSASSLQGATVSPNWLHGAEAALPLPAWLVPANVLVWVAAIVVSVWNRALAIGEKARSISTENVHAFIRLLDESRSGDAVVASLLEDERCIRAQLESAAAANDPKYLRAARLRHVRAIEALKMCLRRTMLDDTSDEQGVPPHALADSVTRK